MRGVNKSSVVVLPWEAQSIRSRSQAGAWTAARIQDIAIASVSRSYNTLSEGKGMGVACRDLYPSPTLYCRESGLRTRSWGLSSSTCLSWVTESASSWSSRSSSTSRPVIMLDDLKLSKPSSFTAKQQCVRRPAELGHDLERFQKRSRRGDPLELGTLQHPDDCRCPPDATS